MLTNEEKAKYIEVLDSLKFNLSFVEEENNVLFKIDFRTKNGLDIPASFSFQSKQEIEEFMKPLIQTQEINSLENDAVAVRVKSGLYQEGRYELEFLHNEEVYDANGINNLHNMTLEKANKEIQDKKQHIERIADKVSLLTYEQDNIRNKYNYINNQIQERKNNIFKRLKKIDLKYEMEPQQVKESVMIDMKDLLDQYTRTTFTGVGEGSLESKKVSDELKKGIGDILDVIVAGNQINLSVGDYQALDIHKMNQLLDSISNISSSYLSDLEKTVQENKSALHNLTGDSVKFNKTRLVSKELKENSFKEPNIEELKTSVDQLKFNLGMYSQAREEEYEYAQDREYNLFETKEAFKDIEVMQQELLTPDERQAINLYKTQLYRSMNPILKYIRSTPMSYEEMMSDPNINEMVTSAYNEMVESAKNEEGYQDTSIKEVDEVFGQYKDNKGIPPLEAYKELVVKASSYVPEAISKITIPEDIEIYRGIPDNCDSFLGLPDQLLSTSLSPEYAMRFAEREILDGGHIRAFYKITLKAGSNAIFYTKEMLSGELSNSVNQVMQYDEQREVLLDPSLLDFEEISRNISYSSRTDSMGHRSEPVPLEIIELIASPKKELLDQMGR